VTTTLPSDHGVTVRYWAGARAATGVASDVVDGSTVAAVVEAAVALHPALEPVVAVATFLVDGSASPRDRVVPAGATVEVLPPFAGG
jgi:molybdopterin converting factor small subunit